ncbi:hypothetical protein I551_3796 [Mycobacterium ulcerans str. Harvey]|uniref:Uncharacterized protein n=1 Tax=Mycobacterium ulcerans str. Harvey TaxID=1299332 RepID=A0ABN0QYB1_MYCUL|nr:hypothetical protein I551_3796 [Mycobacterium ulcerans str. Harvey]
MHHVAAWATSGRTDIDQLTLACGPDHKLLEQGWRTRKNAHGDTEWLPPPHLDHGQPRTNTYHHPEKLLRDSAADEGEEGVDRAVVWHAEPMAGKEIDRVRATSALAVIKQHPAMVLFVLSPALALLAVIWWLAGAGWAIAAALAVLVVGVAVVVRKR